MAEPWWKIWPDVHLLCGDNPEKFDFAGDAFVHGSSEEDTKSVLMAWDDNEWIG